MTGTSTGNGTVSKERHFLIDRAVSRRHGGAMPNDLRLRRHLYEKASTAGMRRRRMFRKQAVLVGTTSPGPDDGAAGVREPQSPRSPLGPTAVAKQLPT